MSRLADRGSGAAPPGGRFTVASFNVLAQSYTRHSSFPYAPVPALEWPARWERLRAAVRGARPDVLALQEADPVAEWDAFLDSLGYDCFHAPRPRGAQRDRCVLAWRRDRFRPAAGGPAPRHVGLNLAHLGGERLNKDNQGVLVALEQVPAARGAARPVTVFACAHLHWNPRLEDVKLRQAAYFSRAAAAYRREASDAAGRAASLVFCGDLNSLPGSRTYRYLVSGELPAAAAGAAAAPAPGGGDAGDDGDAEAKRDGPARPQAPRFAVQKALRRAAKTLRVLGVDLDEYEEPRDRAGFERLFAWAREEGRVLLTQNGKMARLRGCPETVLLPQRLTPPQVVQEVTRRYDLAGKDRVGTSVRRCGCGGRHAPLPLRDAAALPFVPATLHGGVTPRGEAVRFTRCGSCGRVTWWTDANTSRRVSSLMAHVSFRPSLEVVEPRGGDAAAHADAPLAAWEWQSGGSWRPLGSEASRLLGEAAASGAAAVRLAVRLSRYGGERSIDVDLASMTFHMPAPECPDARCPVDERAPRRGSVRYRVDSAAAAAAAAAGHAAGHAAAPRADAGALEGLFVRPRDEWEAQLGLRSAYAGYRGGGDRPADDSPEARGRGDGEPEFTNATGTFRGTLDYILYSAASLRVTRLRPLPTAADAARHTAFPSVEWPSDHALLEAELEWCE